MSFELLFALVAECAGAVKAAFMTLKSGCLGVRVHTGVQMTLTPAFVKVNTDYCQMVLKMLNQAQTCLKADHDMKPIAM